MQDDGVLTEAHGLSGEQMEMFPQSASTSQLGKDDILPPLGRCQELPSRASEVKSADGCGESRAMAEKALNLSWQRPQRFATAM